MAASQDTTCHLLALPPELRNHIYHFAFVSNTPVKVTRQGHERSVLLATSSVNHGEALSVFYGMTAFEMDINDWDATALRRLLKVTAEMGYNLRPKQCNVKFGSDAPNWHNLLQWLEWWHSSEARSKCELNNHETPRLEALILAALFTQVSELQRTPWSSVKVAVESQKAVLERLDSGWK